MKLFSAPNIADVSIAASTMLCRFYGEMEEIVRVAERLVARKQQLLERLKEGHLGPRQREEIERHLKEIDMVFDFLDEGELGETGHGEAADDYWARGIFARTRAWLRFRGVGRRWVSKKSARRTEARWRSHFGGPIPGC
jgi:hypothetical protein